MSRDGSFFFVGGRHFSTITERKQKISVVNRTDEGITTDRVIESRACRFFYRPQILKKSECTRLNNSLCHPVGWSVSRSVSNSFIQTHSLILISHTLSLTLSLTFTLTHSLSLSLTLIPSHSHTHSLSISFTHILSPISILFSLTFSLTH